MTTTTTTTTMVYSVDFIQSHSKCRVHGRSSVVAERKRRKSRRNKRRNKKRGRSVSV